MTKTGGSPCPHTIPSNSSMPPSLWYNCRCFLVLRVSMRGRYSTRRADLLSSTLSPLLPKLLLPEFLLLHHLPPLHPQSPPTIHAPSTTFSTRTPRIDSLSRPKPQFAQTLTL